MTGISNKVYFANSGKMDLQVVRLMGVNVKILDNPIGFYGTGLKFGIATLLRTGHKVTLIIGGKHYNFTARKVMIRGKEFEQVFMNDEPMPYTTDLGRNWQVWQAYRELHSNTLDEAGRITDKPTTDDTVIIVEGEGIRAEYLNRGKIFLETKPIAANASIEAHPGKTQYVYYRGVRCGAMPTKAQFTYNILTTMELTEDRTFASQWDVEWKLSTLIPTLDHAGLATQILEGKKGFDQNLAFDNCSVPSPEFLNAAATVYTDAGASQSAKKVIERDQQRKAEYVPATLNDKERQMFLDAFAHLQKLGCSLSPEDVEQVESLGPSTFGLYHRSKDQIFLARMTYDWGMETLVATLFEEWLHKVYKYKDCTRDLQNFLFQRLTALAMGTEFKDPEPPKPEVLF